MAAQGKSDVMEGRCARASIREERLCFLTYERQAAVPKHLDEELVTLLRCVHMSCCVMLQEAIQRCCCWHKTSQVALQDGALLRVAFALQVGLPDERNAVHQDVEEESTSLQARMVLGEPHQHWGRDLVNKIAFAVQLW